MKSHRARGTLVCVFFFVGTISLFAQGSLNPPAFPAPDPALNNLGQPIPNMRTLTQIEPRRPISSLPLTISSSGSYYLTGNLQFGAASGHAITINASNVSLDLMGFTLSSTGSVTGNAIHLNTGLSNIEVKNGVIAGNTTVTASSGNYTITPAGFSNGIFALAGPSASNCQFSHLRIGGCRAAGVDAGVQAIVQHISATQNGGPGIIASSGRVLACTSNGNGNSGIVAELGSIAQSTANANAGDGFSAAGGSVSHCSANNNGADGIEAPSGSITNSVARGNGNNGISAGSGVIAFSRASDNDLNDIIGVGSTRTGNYPSP